jgi:hypothetical protein
MSAYQPTLSVIRLNRAFLVLCAGETPGPEGIALMAACTESVKKRAGFGIFTSTWTTLFGPFDHADPA